jgi:hypothetical protein
MLGVAEPEQGVRRDKVGEMFLWFETEETSSEHLERPNFDLNRMVLYVRRNPCRMTRGLYPIRLLARLTSSPLPFSTPHIFRLVMTRRVRLAARITQVVHPDRTVEFNVVGFDLLADGVYLEDVDSADGEWREVEAPAPKHLGAEVEDVHGVNAGHGGYVWQTLDEFFFGIGRAEL